MTGTARHGAASIHVAAQLARHAAARPAEPEEPRDMGIFDGPQPCAWVNSWRFALPAWVIVIVLFVARVQGWLQ